MFYQTNERLANARLANEQSMPEQLTNALPPEHTLITPARQAPIATLYDIQELLQNAQQNYRLALLSAVAFLFTAFLNGNARLTPANQTRMICLGIGMALGISWLTEKSISQLNEAIRVMKDYWVVPEGVERSLNTLDVSSVNRILLTIVNSELLRQGAAPETRQPQQRPETPRLD